MRVFVRLLSTLLALALAAAGALIALEVGWHWWQPDNAPLLVPWPSWRNSLEELSWTSGEVLLIAWIAAGVGLILMLSAAVARQKSVRLTDPADEISVATSRRALARSVGQLVRAQENVTGASVTASARKVRVRAASKLAAEHELRPQLITVVTELLNELPLAKKPAVSVVVDSPKDRK